MNLSIITINYNNLEGLKKTFKSVFEQTYQQFEYIVIDGGSTDGSKELIEQNNSKFSYWISEPDNGVYNAMNKGWRRATGNYCLFLNSGDYLNNDVTIQLLIKQTISYPGKNIFYANLKFTDENKQSTELHYYPKTLTLTYFAHSSIGHPSSIISKALLNDFDGYNENYKIISDWIFFIRAFLCGYSFQHIDMLLSVFTLGGISSNMSKQREEMEKAYKEDLLFISQDIKNLNTFRNLHNSRAFKLFLRVVKILPLRKYE